MKRVPRAVLRAAAEERMLAHRDHASSRPLSEDYEFLSLVGEEEFGFQFGYDVDLELRPAGDLGVDFECLVFWPGELPARQTIDVKTARKPFNLCVEKGKARADLYVLAQYNEDETAVMLGWSDKPTVLSAPLQTNRGYSILNHTLPRARLKPMIELFRAVAWTRSFDELREG